MMKYIILLLILGVSACKHNVPSFPAEYVYYFRLGDDRCARYKVISQEPIKLGDPEALKAEDCPTGTIGIRIEETPAVRDWIKAMQKSLSTCK